MAAPAEGGEAFGFHTIAAPRFHAAGMAELPDHDDWLTPPEARRLQGFAYTKRREEARLGRWTAKQALALALGVEADPATLRALVIRNAPDGAPEVVVDGTVAPVRISMTDRADWAVCVAVAADASGAVGCDLELVEARSDRFVADWFTPAEREVVRSRPDEWDLLANLIWSAKESALKVLRTGLRRDTRSVEVTLLDGVLDGWRELRVATAEGDEFPGWWRRFGDFVLSFASDTGMPPPAPVQEPSPLGAARPSHTWMERPHRDHVSRAAADG